MTGATGFTDDEARTGWNRGAEAWREFVRSGADYYRLEVHGPALLDACQPLEGLRALDLGCGEGYFSRELARAGAAVTGVELSENMLRQAQAQEEEDRLGIDYRLSSAADIGRHWKPESFDLVTGCMSLQDMSDGGRVLRAARELLSVGGRMVFSIPHPCTDTPFREWERDEHGQKKALKIDRYFEGGPAVCAWNMGRLIAQWETPCWRRTLTEWTTITAGAGFLIRRLLEPRPSEEQITLRPELEDCFRLPYFLIFDLVPVAAT